MKIGIIFAMKEEMDALTEHLIITKEYSYYDLNFYESIYNNITCVLVESGVGKVNSARATQVLIDKFDINYIFNIGVAGGISDNLSVGDIVIGEKLIQHDFDITSFNHEKGYIPNVGTYISSSDYLVNLVKNIDNSIKYGVIASGDIFVTNILMSNKIHNKFNALCVEMEGASIAHVAYLCNIPFLIIRCISDVPNNNNTITYNEFLESSSKNVAKLMIKIIENISCKTNV